MTTGNAAQNFFCSIASREAGERVIGTASVGNFWVLIEYAGVWSSNALEGSTLPREIKSRLLTLSQTIPRARVLFIRRGRAGTSHLNLFTVRSSERRPSIVKFRFTRYEDLTGLDFDALAKGETVGGEPTNEPLYLVCTHGRRDKCCAKFGWPLYRYLREHAGECVWQSSHVGGDRFAANLLCFPHGLFYARMDEESGMRVVDEYRRGRILTQNYRGRACYVHPVQAAEYFVRTESGAQGVEDLRHISTERLNDETRRIRFSSADGETLHEATVVRRESNFRNLISCHAAQEKHVPQYALEEYRTLPTTTLIKT